MKKTAFIYLAIALGFVALAISELMQPAPSQKYHLITMIIYVFLIVVSGLAFFSFLMKRGKPKNKKGT